MNKTMNTDAMGYSAKRGIEVAWRESRATGEVIRVTVGGRTVTVWYGMVK